VQVIGENENVPAKGPFILVGNHSNQFVDGLMFLTIPKRNVYLLMAAKSLKKAGVGWFGAAMRAIPVRRPQDEAFPGTGRLDLSSVRAAPTSLAGVSTKFKSEVEPKAIIEVEKRTAKVLSVESDTSLTLAPPGFTDKLTGDGKYKIWPHIAQAEMYEGSYRAFLRGACVGLFPEGGSHDRGELIPIKAGVALMAFELMSRIPTLEVPIVACGLNYYQGHRFHGRVVLLFGAPLLVTRAMYEEYLVDRTGAVNRLIARVQEALYHVVLEFPDHSTFVFIQTMRNLFRPDHKRLTDHENFKLMYQLKILHNATKNNEQTKVQGWRNWVLR
jgi:glycerol-3-phosphate O-acyltransferase/dihydroxyacetone phosphate acyltransferase